MISQMKNYEKVKKYKNTKNAFSITTFHNLKAYLYVKRYQEYILS